MLNVATLLSAELRIVQQLMTYKDGVDGCPTRARSEGCVNGWLAHRALACVVCARPDEAAYKASGFI